MSGQGQGGWPPPGGGAPPGGYGPPGGGAPPGGFGPPGGGAPPGGFGPPGGGAPPGGFGPPGGGASPGYGPPGGAPPGYGPPQQGGYAAPPPAPPKKSRKGLIIGCCSGCLLLVLGCVGTGGYLVYLEEGQDRYKPGEEVASQPFTGREFTFAAPVATSGYRHYRLWLAFDVDLPPDQLGASIYVNGRAKCDSYASSYGFSYMPTVDVTVYEGNTYRVANYSRTGSTVTAWVMLADEYTRSGRTITCRGEQITVGMGPSSFEPRPIPLRTARLVMTQQPQRPSDWF